MYIGSALVVPTRFLFIIKRASSACRHGVEALFEQGHVESAVHALSRTQGPLSTSTYLSLLHACTKSKSLPLANLLHAHLSIHRAHLTAYVADFWVMTLAKCGAIDDALQVSATLPHLTVFSWTALIFACAECGRGLDAFRIYQRMLDDGVEPDKYTFVSLFKACGTMEDLQLGKKLHADACRMGITFDVFVCNTLVSMYGKCGVIIEAEGLFCAMSHRTVVSWNAMLSAYVELEHGESALLLYRQMKTEGESVNELTFVLAVQACGSPTGQPTEKQSLQIARALHVDAFRKGYAADTLVGNTLVSIYGKCGAISEAANVFVQIYDHNVVSWTAVISTYMECDQGEKALQLFAHMHKEGVIANQLTYMVALQACGTLIEKEKYLLKEDRSLLLIIVQALHADFHGQGYTSDALVGNTLISVYGKCGAMLEAEAVYHGLSTLNVVSHNVMLSAYIEQGEVDRASQFYKQVQVKHADVDEVTLICMLKLSSEMGSVETCSNVHFSIVSAGYDSAPSVSATLIHAYGSCGSSINAQNVFNELHDPDRVLENALIAGCVGEGDHFATLQVLEKCKAEGLQPDKVSFTSVLSACCHTGLIMEGLEYFNSLCMDCGVTPDLQHYGILIDLLGRAGSFARIENLLQNMTMPADVGIWLCLLGACRTHGNLELAKFSFQNAVRLLPDKAVAYVLISNIYNYFGEQHLEVENLD